MDCFRSARPIPQFLELYMTQVYKLQYSDSPDFSQFKKIFEDHLNGRDPSISLEWMDSNQYH